MLGVAPDDPQNPMALMLMTVGIIAIAMLLTISIRGKIARRNAERPSPRELIEQIKATGQEMDGAHAATAEFVETTRRLTAQLDNKARQLVILIEEADQRIAALSAQPASAAAPPPDEVMEQAAFASGASTDDRHDRVIDSLTRSVYEHADAGLSSIQIAKQLDEQVGKIELILALREVS